MKDKIFLKLNDALINHYDCFNRERFILDDIFPGGVSVITSSISDTCPFELCRNIARYIKRFFEKEKLECPTFIYVGC